MPLGDSDDQQLEQSKSSEQRLICCKPPLTVGTKLFLYITAWGIVILITLVSNPADFLAAYAFPIGLLGVLPIEKAIVGAWLTGLAAVAVGWTIYMGLTLAMFFARRASVFWRLFLVFCVLLALNFVGCRRVLDAAAGIH